MSITSWGRMLSMAALSLPVNLDLADCIANAIAARFSCFDSFGLYLFRFRGIFNNFVETTGLDSIDNTSHFHRMKPELSQLVLGVAGPASCCRGLRGHTGAASR